ncbi:GapA-binding peptide SR1P [Metabacillus niabensis]|uniref:GapA-binding peptide SR1P n=1 Tax=Metabacillus niabensis TaxID=324854 RepID=UPI003612639A
MFLVSFEGHIIRYNTSLNAFIYIESEYMIERGMGMCTIVCQNCNSTIGHLDGEKVTTLYGKCDHHECRNESRKSVN